MADSVARIMVVEKTLGIAPRLQRLLEPRAHHVIRESTLGHAAEHLERARCDVLIVTSVALQAGDGNGLELLELVAANSPETQVLFITEQNDVDLTAAALRAGSYQYAKLPIEDAELRMLVEAALAQRQTGERVRRFVESHLSSSTPIIGESPAMQPVFLAIQQAATTDIPVLIAGETGTGKDLVAQAIHQSSARSSGPYIPIHLGAIPPELVASELFGHEKGAFTGAQERRAGRFEEGNDGTILLDEISTIDERVQISLLRLIEHRRFNRLGGRKLLRTNARIIAATNQSLRDLVEHGAFRDDLYYRLDVFRIETPPLRERNGDVPLLVDAFIQRYNRTFHKNIEGAAPETTAFLEAYAWPGNVRELKNAVQRAVLSCGTSLLLPEHLPPRLRDKPACPVTVPYVVGTPLHEFEREAIVRTLRVAATKKDAATMLGISRRALYNKIRKYGIE